MNDWLKEASQAPKDAWALLLGLASACSILALMRHEFASEPVRLIVANWQYWAHGFWSWIGQLVHLHIPKGISEVLTVLVLTSAVYYRGKFRGQSVATFDAPNMGFVTAILSLVLVAVGFVFVTLATAHSRGDPELTGFAGFVWLIALLCSIGMVGYAFLHTPRSFFAVVIAAIALLLIDRIPLLPAATTAAG